MSAEEQLPVENAQLHVPELSELASVLQEGLKENFQEAVVDVVDCPDLTQAPWCLAAAGICGSNRLADVGGPPYLIPLPKKEKIGRYDLGEIAKLVGLPGAFVFGAGAGSSRLRGVNCEMMPNSRTPGGEHSPNKCSYTAKVSLEDGSCILERCDSDEFSLLANLSVCEGKRGKVVRIQAKQRSGQKNFVTCMRETLAAHYKEKAVGMGGVFQIEVGKANLHVMPDFSKTPLQSDADVEKWLKFFEVSAPLTCLSTFVSHDPGLDLRVEHTHCFSQHGAGGHYHYDTTPIPDHVSYLGYYVPAESVYRVDRPKESHQIGRD